MIPGTALKPFVIDAVSPGAMREWAAILADPNPIHLDPEAVKALGLGDRVINQGPANVAYVMNLLAANFPGHPIESFDCRFTGNVFAGDRCVAQGRITAVLPDAITCELWLEVNGEANAITATATIGRQSRS